MNNKNIFVKLDELLLDIYVIGYPDKGESQIVIIRDSKNVYFTCVIDCYRHKTINKTIETLRLLNIQHLDMFIWTHTDEDHSLDIENLVNDFCDKDTIFILPELVYGNIKDFVDYSQEIKKSLDLINTFNKGTTYNVATASVTPNGHSSIYRNKFIDTETTVNLLFEVIAVAPCSALLRRRADNGNITKKNDLSIATIFKVGGMNIFMSGDIEDQTIAQIADYHFENINYIKTPHHTSTTSIKFIDKIRISLNEKVMKSVSTVYKSHNLPHPDVVEKYKVISKVFSSTGVGAFDYGVDFTRFNVINKAIVEENFCGNCSLIFG